jgi:hypothetical protein
VGGSDGLWCRTRNAPPRRPLLPHLDPSSTHHVLQREPPGKACAVPAEVDLLLPACEETRRGGLPPRGSQTWQCWLRPQHLRPRRTVGGWSWSRGASVRLWPSSSSSGELLGAGLLTGSEVASAPASVALPMAGTWDGCCWCPVARLWPPMVWQTTRDLAGWAKIWAW